MSFGQAMQPFEAANVFNGTATGTEGRNPDDWGTPNDPSHGVLGSGDTHTPATGFQMAPGDEFAYHDISEYLSEDYHGVVLDTTPDNPPGMGVNVPVAITGYDAPTDPAYWEAEAQLVEAHQDDQGGPLRLHQVWSPDMGSESAEAWEMLATNHGADIGGPVDESGLLVSQPGSDRPARDFTTHNRAKMLIQPVVDYSERPWFNNIAAVSPQTEAPRSYLAPSNSYSNGQAAIDPGPGVVWASPPDPQIVPAATSGDVNPGLEWM